MIFYTPIWVIQGTNSGSGGKQTGKRKKDHKQTPNIRRLSSDVNKSKNIFRELFSKAPVFSIDPKHGRSTISSVSRPGVMPRQSHISLTRPLQHYIVIGRRVQGVCLCVCVALNILSPQRFSIVRSILVVAVAGSYSLPCMEY